MRGSAIDIVLETEVLPTVLSEVDASGKININQVWCFLANVFCIVTYFVENCGLHSHQEQYFVRARHMAFILNLFFFFY